MVFTATESFTAQVNPTLDQVYLLPCEGCVLVALVEEKDLPSSEMVKSPVISLSRVNNKSPLKMRSSATVYVCPSSINVTGLSEPNIARRGNKR